MKEKALFVTMKEVREEEIKASEVVGFRFSVRLMIDMARVRFPVRSKAKSRKTTNLRYSIGSSILF